LWETSIRDKIKPRGPGKAKSTQQENKHLHGGGLGRIRAKESKRRAVIAVGKKKKDKTRKDGGFWNGRRKKEHRETRGVETVFLGKKKEKSREKVPLGKKKTTDPPKRGNKDKKKGH